MKRSLFVLVVLFTATIAKANESKNRGTWFEEEASSGSATAKGAEDSGENKRSKRKSSTEAKAERLATAESPNIEPEKKEENSDKPKRKAELSAVEQGYTLKTSEQNLRQTLLLRTGSSCVSIDYAQAASEIISCELPLKINYRLFACDSKKVLESGKNEALVRCKGPEKLQLSFRTKDEIISANLNVVRKGAGRRGSIATYAVDRVTDKDRSFENILPQPEIVDLEEPQPKDAPLIFRFSGFASLEYESSNKFGYDAGGTGLTAAQNFSDTVRPRRSTGTFFSDLNFGITKDRTSLDSIIELGEIYFGDSGSGGGQ